MEDGRVDRQAGPYDLVIAADGARSRLRAATGLVRAPARYPWGALWAILDDPEERHGGMLAQVYRGTREMLGFLASGSPAGVAAGVAVLERPDRALAAASGTSRRGRPTSAASRRAPTICSRR